MLRLITIISITITPWLLYGQSANYPSKRIKKIESKNLQREGEVYLLSQLIDSTGKINVYLMNRSINSIKFHGYNYKIGFVVEAINQRGEWRKLGSNEYSPVICGTGFSNYVLPKNTYTWQSFNKALFEGELETKMRFSYKAGDTLIYSKPFAIRIDPDLFFDSLTYQVNKIMKFCNNSSPEDSKKCELMKGRIFINNQQFEKGIAILKSLLKEYPNYYEAIYYYAKALVTYIAKDEKSTKFDEYIILSKTIEAMEEIPLEHEKYTDAQKFIQTYKEYLPDKSELNNWCGFVPNAICEKIGNEYYGKITRSFLNEIIKIRFKEN